MKCSAGYQSQTGDGRSVRLPVDMRFDTSSAIVTPDENVVRRFVKDSHCCHASAQHLGPLWNGRIIGVLFAGRQRAVAAFFPVEVTQNPTVDDVLLVAWNEARDDAETRRFSTDDDAAVFAVGLCHESTTRGEFRSITE